MVVSTTAAEPMLLVDPPRPRPSFATDRSLSAALDVVAMLTATPILLIVEPASPWVVAGVLLCWLLAQRATRHPIPFECAGQRGRQTLRGAILFGLGCWVADALLPSPVSPPALLAFTAGAGATTLVVRCLDLSGTRRRPLRALILTDDGESSPAKLELGAATRGRMVGIGACSLLDLSAELDDVRPDVVLALPSPALSDRALQRAGWLLESSGVPLLVSTRLADVMTSRTTVVCAGAMDLVHVAPAAPTWRWLKGAWERSAAAVLLLLVLPALLLVMLVVRLDSRGPALFRQTRIGRDGRTFTMLKLRTMVEDAPARLTDLQEDDEADGVLFKIRADPRITRVGHYLRRYSVDELPQLLNVIRGDMALVGPRPALPSEVAAYDHDPRRRLVVKPGLTGLWQVSGRSELSWDESVTLDLDYVDNWSIGRDLVILARTLGAVLGHRGAY